jgi:hypothetical protein
MDFLIVLALSTLAVPGRANANVSIAADGPTVAVAWAASAPGGATDIYAATSADSARTFSAPVRVNDVDGDARVSGEQPPRVALVPKEGSRPAIVVVWTAKGSAGTRLLQARSDDGGRTFSRAAAVPGSDAAGNRGWEAIAVSEGRVDAVWLDHRDMAAGHEGHMSPQQSRLYFGPLDGRAAAHSVTTGVCYCCKTALAAAGDGSIYAAWRHVYPGNLRDIAFTSSRDGGRTFEPPIRVSEDHWMLDGCPDDGPAMAVDAKHRIHIVWPTLVQAENGEPTIALFFATSTDGRRFTARQQVPTTGMPHHPQIAVRGDGTIALAWDELKDGTRRAAVATATIGANGKPTFADEKIVGEAPAIYPALAESSDALVVAWTSGAPSNSTIAVERVAVRPGSTRR